MTLQQYAPTATDTLDPITLEVQWSRLISIMDEADTALVRTAFSTIVGEARDFAVIMLDQDGRSIAQSNFSSPAFTVTLPRTCKHFLEVFGRDTMRPGDVYITNDPWLASGHLPDCSLVMPVFHRDKLVAFMATAAHMADIGGTLAWFEARDLFEEGLRIPPTRLWSGGQPNPDAFNFIRANVRVPDMVVGDMGAIRSGQLVGAQRLVEFLDDYNLPDLRSVADHILSRSESAMRRAIAELPDGQWRGEARCDGYLDPVQIIVTVTKQGEEMWIDFTGSSDQVAHGSINNVMNLTFADTCYSVKCSLTPTLPNNEGMFRPIHAAAPAGNIFNTTFPSAVKSRSKISFHIHNAIYAALVKIAPRQVQAGSGSFWSITTNGFWPDGQRFNCHFLPNGGKGAVHGMDGLPTVAFPYNGTATPAEIFENVSPMLMEVRELLPDSGGAGEYRGGLSQRLVLSSVSDLPVTASLRPDKLRFPAPGINGGQPGKLGTALLNGETPPPGTSVFHLNKGDRIIFNLPGGGGFGPAWRRPIESVLEDVRLGLVTPSAAREEYGVVLGDKLDLDAPATKQKRAEMSAATSQGQA